MNVGHCLETGPGIKPTGVREQIKYAQLFRELCPLNARVNPISQDRLLQSQASHHHL